MYGMLSIHFFFQEQPLNCLETWNDSFIKIQYGEPWRRHLTTDPQLNSSIEGLSVLPDTTTMKPAFTKLRTITNGTSLNSPFPSPRLDAIPSLWSAPPSPHIVLGFSKTLIGAWMSKNLRTPLPWPYCRPRDPWTNSGFSQTALSHSQSSITKSFRTDQHLPHWCCGIMESNPHVLPPQEALLSSIL